MKKKERKEEVERVTFFCKKTLLRAELELKMMVAIVVIKIK